MASRIHSLLQTYPSTSFFFALGTGITTYYSKKHFLGHFLGENSIIHLLGEHGYYINPVEEHSFGYFSEIEDKEATFNQLWVRNEPGDPVQISISMLEVSNTGHMLVFSVCYLLYLYIALMILVL